MRLRASIRTKLALLSLALLSIPLVGYHYVREMERHLQAELENALEIGAELLAGRMQDETDLFPTASEKAAYRDDSLFLHRLDHPIQIDGYTDDWSSYLDWATEFKGRAGFGYRLLLGQYQQDIFALIDVADPDRVYRRQGGVRTVSDRLHVVVRDGLGRLRRYALATSAPGPQHPYQMLRRSDGTVIERALTNIAANWQESTTGYTIELRIPDYLVGDALSFEVLDVDDPEQPQVVQRLGTAGTDTLQAPSPLLRTSERLEKLLQPMAQIEGRRVWVLGRQGQVLASAGSLRKEIPKHPLSLLFALILPSAHERFEDDLAGASRLTSSDVRAALNGEDRIRWRSSPDNRAVIVSAAHPIHSQGDVRGAVMIEETTNSIQTIQREAMADLFNVTLFTFSLVTLLLLGFATRLSLRLRRLVRDSETAIDPHGRVVGEMSESQDRDEIGDLSRSFAAMLERLKEYNGYLEAMAGRLAHELQTPLAVVRSSLESLDHKGVPAGQHEYLERATAGCDRLARVIHRLRESTRIEQALQSAEKEPVELGALLDGCVAGYRDAYRPQRFEWARPETPLTVQACPDLLVQMLDKLIANAVDYCEAGRAITVELSNSGGACRITVQNPGPRLPDTMTDELFNSLISLRTKSSPGENTHLGLGLYVARLIAEFHGGTIGAANLPTLDGVEFSVVLPQ